MHLSNLPSRGPPSDSILPDASTVSGFFTAHTAVHDIVEALLAEQKIPKKVQNGSKTARAAFVLSINSVAGSQVLDPSLRMVDALSDFGLQGPPFELTLSLSPHWLDKAGTVAAAWHRPLEHSPHDQLGNPKVRPTVMSRSETGWRPSSIFGMWSASSEPEQQQSSSDSEDEGHDEDTLKAQRPHRSGGEKQTSRLSSFFDGWLDTSPSTPNSSTLKSRAVSGPMSVGHRSSLTIDTIKSPTSSSAVESSSLEASATPSPSTSMHPGALDDDFELLIHDLGIKGPQAESMRLLSGDRKTYLLSQHRASSAAPLRPQQTGPASRSTAASGVWDLRRFSLASMFSNQTEGGTSSITDASSRPSSALNATNASGHSPSSSEASASGISGLPVASTVSSWTAWLSPSSKENHEQSSAESAADDIIALSNARAGSQDLARRLIGLRVRLSTNRIQWSDSFVQNGGFQALHKCLRGANKRAQNGKSNEYDEAALMDSIRSMRALLNTQVSISSYSPSSRCANLVFEAGSCGGACIHTIVD